MTAHVIKRWSYSISYWKKIGIIYGITFIAVLGWLFIEPIELQAVNVSEEIIKEKARYVLVTDVSIENELHSIKYIDSYFLWIVPIQKTVLVVTNIDVKPNNLILLNRVDVNTICEYYNENGEKTNPDKFIKIEYKTDFYGYCGESYYYEILE